MSNNCNNCSNNKCNCGNQNCNDYFCYTDRALTRALNCICETLREVTALAPSYATFWQTDFVTVDLESDFPFNFTGPTTPDITLSSPTTVLVQKAGVYHINFRVAVSVSRNDNPNDFVDQRVSLYVNDVQQPNTQASFGFFSPDIISCVALAGDAIVYIPANATLKLKNDGEFSGSSSITTCDNGVNAVTFNIIKIG